MHLRTPVLQILLAVLLLPMASRAENITVGPFSDGCDQTTIAAAFLRAAITPESDTIFISTDLTWTGAGSLVLTNESPVTLQGVSSCSDFFAVRRDITTTVGDLFRFNDTRATFRDVRLLGDTAGRLVTATGTSVIVLEDSLVLRGRADDGGNVHLSGGASLLALAGSAIFSGEATFNGGGVYCTGGGVVGLGEGSRLYQNNAGFNGGGVYVDGCTLNILTGGVGSVGTDEYGVLSNRAEFNGGGVYARGGSSVLLSGHATRPGSIVNNTAVDLGGGMYLTGSGTTAQVFNSEIVDNRGVGGAGGVMVTSGATFLMERTVADCNRGDKCSFLAENNVGLGSAAVAEGGALMVTGGGEASVRQTYLTHNVAEDGGHVALVSGGGSFLLIENSVLYDNHSAGLHLIARGGGHVRLAFVSAWGSSAPGFGMAFAHAEASSRIDLYSSILIEGQGSPFGGGPGTDTVFLPPSPGAFHDVDCSIVHETVSTGGFGTVVTDPSTQWVFPSIGDPHLLGTALAIDFCDDLIYSPVDADIDNEPRGFDVTTVPDGLGPFDLGADEWLGPPPLPPEIFSDGFESGNVSAWSGSVP